MCDTQIYSVMHACVMAGIEREVAHNNHGQGSIWGEDGGAG